MDRPSYMRWFFPLSAGVFITLAVAWAIGLFIPALNPFPAWGPSVEDEQYQREKQHESGLRSELAVLQENLRAKRSQCEALVRERPQIPSPPQVQAAPTPPPSAQVEKPQQKDDNLIIPESAKNDKKLDFLKGCWICETGLQNTRTGAPVKIVYCFDANGKGKREQIEPNDKCIGNARASLNNDGELSIKADTAKCIKRRGAYVPQLVVCHPNQDGLAICLGTEKGSSWQAEFKRTSE